jgi:hypothetical protein
VTPQRIVQTDSVFEATLGLTLIGGAAAGWLGPGDFPAPVGTPVIVGAGCALLIVAALLWQLASAPVAPRLLRILATANLATAAAALAWRLVATGFSTAGSALTLATASALAVLAAAQLSAAQSSNHGVAAGSW